MQTTPDCILGAEYQKRVSTVARQHLHKQFTVLKALHTALPHYGSNVVLIVGQAIQSKGCIVLQVAIARRHQLQQRWQPTSLNTKQE